MQGLKLICSVLIVRSRGHSGANQLQAQTNSLVLGLGANWVDVGGSTGVNSIVLPINLTNGSVFYRLIYR